ACVFDEFAQMRDGSFEIGGDHCYSAGAVRSGGRPISLPRGSFHAISAHHVARAQSRRRARFLLHQLGLKETRRRVDEKNRYTLVFLIAPEDESVVEDSKKKGRPGPEVELTYNWDSEDYGEARYFGHLAYEVDDIYATCDRLMQAGVTINRPPRDGVMSFVRSPDRHSIELLQKGAAKPPQEPWKSMPNTGKW